MEQKAYHSQEGTPSVREMDTRMGYPKRVGNLSFVLLALLLASCSHRASPVSGAELLPGGKTPRASRRAHPPEISLRKASVGDLKNQKDAIPELHPPERWAAFPTEPQELLASKSSECSQQTKPDYLKFYKASQVQGHLSPPA